ncbi:MAG: T9SS type A sorting domain-containing protein [Flavobacteriales bacterium]|jgi:hypothetical protein|nr:T9SS type A sorting domain-containing protein [Flavobacteriales bacterium]
MRPYLILIISFLLSSLFIKAQYYVQYFDGADTSVNNSILIDLDSTSSNIWQVGPPQKSIFDSAATAPNALVTDTINFYPINNTSSFQYTILPWHMWGIIAIQWKQKLDMDQKADGGLIEFSTDGGTTWDNAFNNPYVYNFYGYDTSSIDTLNNGSVGFTGTDSTWKDIWLCYDMNWVSINDSIIIRHTFLSDSINNNKEGWLIDNMMMHVTWIHTINEKKQEDYMSVSPKLTSGIIDISTKKLDEFHIIEKIELINLEGKTVKKWGVSPTKFYIDISDQPNGIYLLNITTNKQAETFKIVLEH